MKKILKGYLLGFLTAVLVMGGTAYAANRVRIFIDYKEIVPKDLDGNIVDPIIVDGTTYVPVRAVAHALNCLVAWNAEKNAVEIMTSDYYLNNIKPYVLPESNTNCYPDTIIPTYTSVTGESVLKTENSDTIKTYVYSMSEKVVDYVKFLYDNGWDLYDTEITDEYSTYYIVKDGTMIDVSLMYNHNQIWISY